jgi:two-component system phosphate regulon sensor histidine kinase PhoR
MLQVREEYRREFLGNVSHELKTFVYRTRLYIYFVRWGNGCMILKKILKACRKRSGAIDLYC